MEAEVIAAWHLALLLTNALASIEQGPRCEAGGSADAARTRVLMDRLRASRAGRSLAPVIDRPVCYATGEPGISERQITLARDDDDSVAAARLGHLLLHAREGLPYREATNRDCKSAIARARASEETAHHLEAQLRRELGAPPLARDAVDRVVGAYLARCERSKRR
jgi:hypothetical protein